MAEIARDTDWALGNPVVLMARSVAYLDAYSIGNLLLCGNKQLNRCLARLTRRFDLLYSSKMQIGWPRIISRLNKLEHVLIGDPLRYFQPFISDVVLTHLPRTLISLHLNFANAHLSSC